MPNLIWRKSSYSSGGSPNCIETAAVAADQIAIRDSKNPTGPALTFPAVSFFTFTSALRDGRL
jgi:uncharacterized protein DUF397